MTQTSSLKSQSITNLDSTPIIPNTAGEGGTAYLKQVTDYVTALSGDSTSSTYKVVRVPTSAHITAVTLYSAVAAAGAADINIAFSDNGPNDGTSTSNSNTIPQVSSANNKLFGAATALTSIAASGSDITYSNTFTHLNSMEPLWQVLGYTTDPGGFFDFQLNVTTQITTGGIIALKVTYTEATG